MNRTQSHLKRSLWQCEHHERHWLWDLENAKNSLSGAKRAWRNEMLRQQQLEREAFRAQQEASAVVSTSDVTDEERAAALAFCSAVGIGVTDRLSKT